MDTDISHLLSTLSDERLQEYIDKRKIYNPPAVLAAIEEFKKRGRVFTDTEIETIKSDLEYNQEPSEQEISEPNIGFTNWNKNLTETITAPELYSERVIYIFSILFSVLFGSILMAINLYRVRNKKAMSLVIVFGIIYTIFEIVTLPLLPKNSGMALLFNIGGALIINTFLWNKYIGKETEYRKRPIWIPLTIGIVISALLLFLIFQNGM